LPMVGGLGTSWGRKVGSLRFFINLEGHTYFNPYFGEKDFQRKGGKPFLGRGFNKVGWELVRPPFLARRLGELGRRSN